MMNYELRGKGEFVCRYDMGDGQRMVQVWIDYGQGIVGLWSDLLNHPLITR